MADTIAAKQSVQHPGSGAGPGADSGVTQNHAGTAAPTGAVTGATIPAHGGDANHAAPSALGFDASMMVALAMIVVIALAIWKKVPSMIGAALDKQIGAIQDQLDAATRLRAEAEAIKAEYAAKSMQAAKDAEALTAHAEEEAKQIIAKANIDATALIARRGKMAKDKIAAAEAAALADIRTKVAAVSALAAEHLIASGMDVKSDAVLIDRAIATLN